MKYNVDIFEGLGAKAIVTEDKLLFEIPLNTLKSAFDNNPENYEGCSVKSGKVREFAIKVAQDIISEGSHDDETGESLLTNAINTVFDSIMEEFNPDILETVEEEEEGNYYGNW